MTGWTKVHVASLLLGIAVGACVVTLMPSPFALSQRSSYKFDVSSVLGRPKASRTATRRQQGFSISHGRRDQMVNNEVVIASMLSWLDGTVQVRFNATVC